ncbi:50S ribosomal protein L25 [Candidatus Falkowbacteria bacterium]|nr:50S ribosomal protein L25 [Candidatus Falkowbacteria bacterium]
MFDAKVQKREGKTGASTIPAVVYGPDVDKSINVEIAIKAAEKLYEQAGTSNLIKLEIQDEKKPREVLIKGVARHPITGDITHLEFYQVPVGQKIETEIELEFVGDSPAEKLLGGVVNKNMSTLPIKCLPHDLISSIQVDLSALKTFDDFIRVSDLKLPASIEPMLENDVIVATAVAVKAEAEVKKVEAAPAADVAPEQEPEKTVPAEEKK